MTMVKVESQRREEAPAAATLLGAAVEFLECGDCPMNFKHEDLDRPVEVYRALRPQYVPPHPLADP
jgi:4-oxalomesaconate hydratase